MTFIRKHKWTLIVLCALVVLWTVLEVTQGLLANYDSSLREQLFGLRNQAQVEAIEAKIEFLQPVIRFVGNSSFYLIYFFMALPLLTLLFKLDSWLTLAYYLLAHLCTYIFSCLIMGGGLEMFTAPLKQSGYMMLRGYLIWAVFAVVFYLRKKQKTDSSPLSSSPQQARGKALFQKHKWTLIVLCSLVVLWTVMDVAGTALLLHQNSLSLSRAGLSSQAELTAVQEQMESLRSISAFFTNSTGYLMSFFLFLPLLTLIFKLEPWLTLAYYLLAHLCTYLFSCLILGGSTDVVSSYFYQSGIRMVIGYLIWAICAIALHFWKGQKRNKVQA